MNKRDYKVFAASIQQMISDFVVANNIPSSCKIPLDDSVDDYIWTLSLGEDFGEVNIMVESWEHASYHKKVNIVSIPIRFKTYRDEKKLFETRYGSVNDFNGKFILSAFDNAADGLKMIFEGVLNIWALHSKYKNLKINESIVNLN